MSHNKMKEFYKKTNSLFGTEIHDFKKNLKIMFKYSSARAKQAEQTRLGDRVE